jgi:4-amino-4-deoxy-L-arabinose transferase-like glycosyltransferase
VCLFPSRLHSTLAAPRPFSILAGLFALAILFLGLGTLPLLDPDEGRNAEVAREMAESGAWLVPTYDGLAYLDKPALYFKAVALSLSVLGDSEGAARLPSALAGLAVLGLVFLFVRRGYGERAAALAVLVVATTPLFFVFARIVILDMTLAFFVCASVMAGTVAEEREGRARRRWHLVGALAAGVATLVKGPVGFLLPWIVLTALAIAERRPDAVGRLFAPRNLLALGAVVLLWFLAVARERPDFLRYGLVEESLRRFTTRAFRRNEPFYFYGPVVAAGCFPWSLLLPASAGAAWIARRRWSRADRLSVVWAVAVVLFFSISRSKLAGYVLTAAIACGVLTARVFDLAFSHREGAAARIVRRAAGGLALLALLGAAAIAVEGLRPGAVSRTFGRPATESEWIRPSLLPAALALLGIAGAALAAFRLRDPRLAFATFLSFPVLAAAACFGTARNLAEFDSSRQLAARVREVAPAAEVACLRCFAKGLPFYLGRPVWLITEDGRELKSNYVVYSLKKQRPWPEPLVPLDELEAWLASRTRDVLLLADDKHRRLLDPVAVARGAPVREIGPGWWEAVIEPGKQY